MIVDAPSRSVGTSLGRVAFHDEGDGPTVLLLHGFPASSWQWRELVPLLAARFRVLVPDLPGSGASMPADDVALDLAGLAAAVGELLDALDVGSVALVGHGEGAAVAQSVALDRPGVEALVLLDVATLDAWPSPAIVRARETLDRDGVSAEVVRGVVRDVYGSGALQRHRLPDELVEAVAEPWTGPGGPERFARVVAGLDGRGLAGRERELGAVEAPVLLLWGEDDPLSPSSIGERLQATMPASALGLLPGCGHFLLDEAIETIGPMIAEYLRARYAHAPHGHGDPSSGVVMLQLERRPAWVDLEEDERDDWFDVDDDEEASSDEDDEDDEEAPPP